MICFHIEDFSFSFLSILLEGIPFVLLGSLLSGFIDAFLPSQVMARILPRNRSLAIWLSGLMGMVFPMCECGSVVVIRRFIKKGLPVSSAVTYMLAAPIVNPVVAISTFAAFRGQNAGLMTSLRLSLGFLLAVAIGFIVRQVRMDTLLRGSVIEDLQPSSPQQSCCSGSGTPDDCSETLPEKLRRAAGAAASDFIDVAAFLVIGAAIAAAFNTSVDQSSILPLASNTFLSTIAMMGLAFGMAICSSSDAFVAASFVSFPFTAKLAFLLFGPMFDAKLFFLYSTVFRRRCVIALAIGLFIAVAVICTRLAVLKL